ncbi:ATP-binding protein [Leptolyngbya sp. GGD]|uniref:ATP-binding protein n=1 Tax=Leptolyngbya sp. GGD TaxID=2997907 RepID=UPI00227BDDC9|nr:ATP-binding protein [Leptolyngbya sp. GGD]MCY6493967.1 ATP-binding protein [Leptolyngbya sp. GGD]
MRGRILTNEARCRLEAAIGKRFPYTNHNFAEIYHGAPGYSYNFEQLRRQIQIHCEPNFLMSRDTLQRILCQSQGVDVGSIRKLFSVLNIPLKDQEDLQSPIQVDRASDHSQPKNRSELSRRFCRLPDPTYETFIGRDTELRDLLRYLSPEHRGHIITVDGIGGVGKTTLLSLKNLLCCNASGVF